MSLYATDILLLILFAFWTINYFFSKNYELGIRNYTKGFRLLLKKPDFYLILFVVFSAVSIKNSSNLLLSVWGVVKLVEFVIFYFYIKNYAMGRFGFIPSLVAIIAGALLQSVVAIAQFFMQSEIGLRILGESFLGKDMNGIASFYNLAGEKVIRAYGTTPHPNVLAAYLFLAVFAFYFSYLYFHIYHESKLKHLKINFFLLGSYPLMLLALFFTFARVAVFLWFVGFAVRALIIIGSGKFRKIFGSPVNKDKLIRILVITFVVIVLFGIIFWPEAMSRIKISGNEEAVQLRVFYNKESLETGINWFGVGSGNFVNWLMVKETNLPRYLYQPVHNIYLLVYSETGILGLAAFLLFLVLLIKDFILRTRMQKLYHFSFLLVVLSILFMGLFDHFLLTLQQGRFIFWMVLAILTFSEKDDIVKL